MPSLYQYLNFVTLLTVNIPTLGISISNTLCSSCLHMVIGQNVRSCTNTRTSVDCIHCGQDVFRPPLLYLSDEWRATCTSATCLSWRLFSHTEKWISPPSFWGRTWSCYVRHTASERLFYRIFPMMFGTSFRRQVVVVLTVSRSDTEERKTPGWTPTEILPWSCPFGRVWRTKLSIVGRTRDFEHNLSDYLSWRIQSTKWNLPHVTSRLLTVGKFRQRQQSLTTGLSLWRWKTFTRSTWTSAPDVYLTVSECLTITDTPHNLVCSHVCEHVVVGRVY